MSLLLCLSFCLFFSETRECFSVLAPLPVFLSLFLRDWRVLLCLGSSACLSVSFSQRLESASLSLFLCLSFCLSVFAPLPVCLPLCHCSSACLSASLSLLLCLSFCHFFSETGVYVRIVTLTQTSACCLCVQ